MRRRRSHRIPIRLEEIMKSRRLGFTLVELLVVIGIIAVLVAILLPALQRAKQQARLVECSARLRDIVTASHCYAADNKGWLPPTRNDKGDPAYDYAVNFRNNHGW